MVRKFAALVLVAGLCLPYRFDVQPIVFLREDAGAFVSVGVPILLAFAYAVATLLPPVGRAVERVGRGLHGVLYALFFIFVGLSLGAALSQPDHTTARDWAALGVGCAVGGALVWWSERRGTPAQRVPLLLLATFGLQAVAVLWSFALPALQYGAGVTVVGYVVAVLSEMRALRPAAATPYAAAAPIR
ncbi:MAG TPA: hypothetical protein VEU55_10835 [Gemmatimonadales bacterium]|nr:hypothetical protein [Gemmatimonadales bacterium]